MEISTPRQLLRSLGPLPETSARTPPNFREVPPWAFPVGRLVGRFSFYGRGDLSDLFCIDSRLMPLAIGCLQDLHAASVQELPILAQQKQVLEPKTEP